MNDSKWRAIAEKRPAGFIYAVKTTGIICNCGCVSKTPRRDRNFRPRRRCRTRRLSRLQKVPPRFAAVSAAKNCRRLPPFGRFGIGSGVVRFGERIGNERAQFSPAIYAIFGAYAEAARGNLRTAESVTAAVYDSGFESGARVYENPAAQLGMTPAAYKSGGGDEFVRAAIGESLLGKVLIAATGRGVCAVEFGDSESELCARLKQQFPRAKIDSDDNQFRELVRKTIRLINEPRGAHNLPLDIRATAFQRRVWRALQNIPAGETKTYSQIANDIGAPKSARAVGAACGQIAVIIPCHRAIGKDGKTRGYRWGINRKRKLLEKEKMAE